MSKRQGLAEANGKLQNLAHAKDNYRILHKQKLNEKWNEQKISYINNKAL